MKIFTLKFKCKLKKMNILKKNLKISIEQELQIKIFI